MQQKIDVAVAKKHIIVAVRAASSSCGCSSRSSGCSIVIAGRCLVAASLKTIVAFVGIDRNLHRPMVVAFIAAVQKESRHAVATKKRLVHCRDPASSAQGCSYAGQGSSYVARWLKDRKPMVAAKGRLVHQRAPNFFGTR